MAVKWFDLSRFGAALKVVPNSPLRGVPLTCLEIFDQTLFTSGWKSDGMRETNKALQEAWRLSCADLGFGAVPVTIREPQGSGLPDRVSWRLFSPQLKFTLRDMQALVPGVDASDLREMDEKDIALTAQAGVGMPQAWQQFVFDVLSNEATQVWTPKINPFDKPWAQAETFKEFRSRVQEERDWSPFFTHRGVATFGQFDRVLDEANYRTNALVPYYVDQGSAIADGWKAEELERVDLPYALPLWVSRSGQIQALRDIRYSPEIMDMEPKSYFGRVNSGVVAGALRKARSLTPMVRGHIEQWAKWAADPSTLEMPDAFWGSITEIASEHADLHEKFPSLAGGANLELILDGAQAQRGGAFRARLILEMDQTAMFGLTQLCARYVPMSGDEREMLQSALVKLLARSHELMAEHAQALARESLQEVSSAVRREGNTDIHDASTEAFKLWFGDSQVVDPDGKPLLVYHGTDSTFKDFDARFLGANTGADNTSLGFFFLKDEELARQFAQQTSGGERVLSAYISLKKPLLLTQEGIFNNEDQAPTIYEIFSGERLESKDALAAIEEEIGLGDYGDIAEAVNSGWAKDILVRDGFDGAISRFGEGVLEYIVFEPSQIRIVDDGLKASADSTKPQVQRANDKVRHEDAGEKIGGARKDYAKRAMVYEDLEQMNDAERDIYVVKKNIWGPLNYQQMREDGVSPEAALAIKIVKDKLLTAPDRRERTSLRPDDQDEQYITAVALVRDYLAPVKTLDEFQEAIKTLFKLGNQDHEGSETTYIYGGTALQVQWGKEVCDIFFGGRDGRIPAKVSREIRRKINVFGREPTSDEQWRSMIKPKREKTQDQVEQEKTKTQIDRELHRPHLERVQREGEDWRAGRDIVADDLIGHFGFRAVEFGNWLPQDERQQVLNMAFDSMCDLAEALNLPPKGLSFDGTLACAFGSRGRGGKNAALAHFEPARMVINLTRMSGAGSLAHEWMHGLDWHLGKEKGVRSAFLSEHEVNQDTAMGRLAARMRKRFASEDEILEAATAKARRGLSNTLSWMHGQPEAVRHQLVDVLEGVYEAARGTFYDQAVQVINSGMKVDAQRFSQTGFRDTGAVGWDVSLRQADVAYERIRAKCSSRSALTKVKAKVEPNLNFMMVNLAKACTAQALIDLKVAAPKAFCAGENAKPSRFFVQASKLDKMRAGSYWATTCELFARAGAAYVSDKIEQRGHRSDYLVYGADEGRYADHAIGNPNPTDEDRKALAEHFDELIAEYRLACLKETEQAAVMEP